MYQSYKTDYSTESDNGIGYFVSLIQNFITEYVRRAGRMKNRKVRNFAEFALWTKTRMLERGISQRTGRRNGNTPGQDQRGYHREAIRKEVYHSADPGTGRKHG